MVYLAEKGFTEPSMGQILLLASFIFTGLLCLVVMLLLMMFWWMPKLQKAKKVLEVLLLIFPPYALGGGFLSIATEQIRADLFNEFTDLPNRHADPFSWDVAGRNMTALALEAIIFFLLNLAWEVFKDRRRPKLVENEGEEGAVLRLDNVSKVYKTMSKKFTALSDFNVSIKHGECFGLIGLNGAGKSTTFQMVVGGLLPSQGRVRLGCPAIGFCPQSDSIDPCVTVAEQLQVAAMLKGFDKKQSKEVAAAAMEKLGLVQYSKVLCGDLSGGNKRKVCIAVALMGSPQLVLMDEPTSGLDPGSRRQVGRSQGS